MARKQKTGLEYYNIDTDLFQNRKIKRLIRCFGAKGYLIYSFLLTEIYRDKGYFIEWDSNTAFDVSDTLNESETLINEVVCYCCNLGLFNKELRTSESVLTTENIQEFWIKVSKKANRKCSDVDVRFSLVSSIGTPTREESTPNNEVCTPNNEESKQSKVKKSKVKKSIADRKAEFYNSLIPFLKNYDKSMMKDFFDYWTEHGKNDLKMRFEKEKSFGLSRRLTTWLKNQKRFEKEKSFAKKQKPQMLADKMKADYGIQ